MNRIAVTHRGGDAFAVAVGDQRFTMDQPHAEGGGDTGPTPVEVFVAALAGCVAHYAHRYLARHRLAHDGLTVETDFAMSPDPPARVQSVRMRIALPEELTEARRKALLAVVDHCTVHNSLRSPPDVRIDVDTETPAR
ncbi:OsmC family protein [Streptomonospora sp. PA3]|uniref:OsmC family protein n=1 Tax=Streptomonospora sp. PA3 TaxID=2607326 RepID=UPI0012DEC3A9|nr:OsmC family protein [Streptomonospora sp. PA3]MUL41545.1 OsmC family protein [Streptomonospora sp. PA3]